MAKPKVQFRRPHASEQRVLEHLQLRLRSEPAESARCDALIVEHHYLHAAKLVGEHLRYSSCSMRGTRRLFPPRPTPPTHACRREHNRSRREVRALHPRPVTPEEVGFAGAAPIGQLRTRVRGGRRQTKETRFLITSASQEQLDARGLLDAKRGYWAIESALPYRLDATLDEDQSRVRRGSAAHILGRCRRLVVGFACAGRRTAKGRKQHCRKRTRDFQDHLTAHGFACAFALVTATTPSASLPI